MTVRTRYAQKPTRRRARRDDTRRGILLTITFGVAIAVSLSLVGGVLAANYYSDHGAAVASVNGEAISKDAVRDRVSLNVSRDNRMIQDYLVLRNQGKITADEYTALATTPQTDLTSTTQYSNALNQLTIDVTFRQYASKNGISVTDQQVQDQITTDATIPEMRHVMIIGVAATPTPPASSPTAQDLQDAQNQAQAYLNSITSGAKKWADVSTESQDGSSGATKDVGLTSKADMTLDPDITDAIFNLAKPNDLTPVFKGSDGIYRFATVTSIVAPYVDSGWQNAMAGSYQNFVRAKALQAAIKDSINKKYIDTPSVQRHVLEIAVQPGFGQPGNGDEVKISIMVFAPNHTSSSASGIATTDPAWADAKSRADAAVATLRADPTKFDSMARDTKTNDDVYWNASGGSIPWIPADLFNAQTAGGQTGLAMTSVETAVFQDGIANNTILDPIQETSQGYVVVKFQGRRPAPDQRIADAQLKISAGADFATVAKDVSESADSAEGGDMGWVSRYMLTPDQEAAVYSTPVGSVSRLVSNNGYWIYKVVDEQTRLPDAATAEKLTKVVFQQWANQLQTNTNIWTDQAGLTALSPASPSP
jgi:parvulin-like peptidyl-prolyl isomerase